MKIAIVTDEVSSDAETALELIHMWGADSVELRGIDDERYPRVAEYWAVRLPELLAEYQLSVVAISPGLFQIPPPGRRDPMHFSRRRDTSQVRQEHHVRALCDDHVNKLLPDSIEAAKRLGAQTIICFSFGERGPDECDPASPEIIEIMRYAASKVAEAGLTLNIETSPYEPGQRCADIVRRVDHSALGLNWDPGARYMGGDERPFPECYSELRPFVRHVHFKDVWKDPMTGKRSVVVDGIGDWHGAFAALRADAFDGYISVETHRRPKVQDTHYMFKRLRALVHDAES
jgi:sugar phosphate isomerase/epimerase